jgi:CubicO group peptidase (beta-lactamase class C family)
MKRRWVLGGLAAAAATPLLGTVCGVAHAETAGPASGPPTITPDDLRFHRRRLRPGSPREAGLLPEYVERIVPDAATYLEPGEGRPKPSHAGFVVLAARKGVIVSHDAGGYAVRYSGYDADTDTGVELPAGEWVPMAPDTIFDMASVSKLFTSMVATQLAAEDRLDLDAPVADYIPAFAAGDPDKAPITLMHLLRHVSGLKSWINLTTQPDNAARMQAIYDSPLQRPPGSGYEYSDLNLITLGAIIELVTDSTLDAQVAERITGPLGLDDTGYNPPESWLDRIAATEYQAGRGVVRGRVHDENAHSFGGVAGHAGVFSTAADMAVFGQLILNGGSYDGVRLLSEDWVRKLLTNYNADLPAEAGRGLGWQLDQRFYMDAMTSPLTAGHTGFTGTCLVLDPLSESLYVLLTNRVHPTRNWGSTSEYRRAPARDLARALPVDPHGRRAWFGGQADATTATLTLPLDNAVADGRVEFRLWFDTEPTDTGELLTATASGAWQRVGLRLQGGGHQWDTDGSFAGFEGRQWLSARAIVPDGTTRLRWTYVTDAIQQGRGVYVDDVKVYSEGRCVFDGEHGHDADRFEADGWVASAD